MIRLRPGRLIDELYGRPEQAVPFLCLAMGVVVTGLTGSLLWGAASVMAAGGLWHAASPYLVIDDLRLGSILLRCPAYDTRGRPLLWLTFDDGPGPETAAIVRALNARGQRATFFFIGRQMEEYDSLGELALLLKEGGHRVANHSHSHPNFLFLSATQASQELKRCQYLLEHHFQGLTVPFFRPPFGYRNRTTLALAAQDGLEIAGWSANSLDFLQRPTEPTFDRLRPLLQPGVIALFHDGPKGRQGTLELVTRLLDWMDQQGYQSYRPAQAPP